MLKALLVAALAVNSFAFVPRSPSFFSQRTNTLKMSSEADASAMLDPSETALVLIEYQNEFTTEGNHVF